MAYSYKTKELLDSKVNFAAIFFEKQDKVKEMTGFDFNLADIVRFLKSETDNFQNPIELAIEIDKAIYGIYQNWSKEKAPKESTPSEPIPTETEDVEITDEMNIEAIDFMIELLPDLTGEDKESTIEAIEFVNELLPANKVVKIPKNLLK
jgi:hypothetical protein